MTARYKLMSKVFLEPTLYPAETVIDYDGIPSIHMEPMNAEAEAAIAKRWPGQRPSRDPLAALPTKIDPKDALVKPTTTVVSGPPKPVPEPSLTNPPPKAPVPEPVQPVVVTPAPVVGKPGKP